MAIKLLSANQTLLYLATLPHCVVRGENKLNRAEMQIFPRGGERGREAGPQEYKSPAKLLFAFLPLFNRKHGRSGGGGGNGIGRGCSELRTSKSSRPNESLSRVPNTATHC